jgi:arylsulfatase A-like enzyme
MREAFEASFQKGKSVFLGGMADHYNIPVCDLGNDRKLSEPVNKGFSSDVFAAAAIDFIKEYSAGDRMKPFFCYVAFTAPHDPYSPRSDFIDIYSPDSIPLPGNFMPLHPFAFDDLLVRDENLTGWPRNPEIIRSILADYYALITHLDVKVGDIIRTLKEVGLFDNTIIVYAADNGLAAGSHGLLGKQNLYEHSTRVPFMIAGPGSRRKISMPFYLFDIYPTLIQCRFTQSCRIDGEDQLPVIKGDLRSKVIPFHAFKTIRDVRIKEWKLIRYPERDYTHYSTLRMIQGIEQSSGIQVITKV